MRLPALSCKDGKKIYDAADTGLFGDMNLIGEEGIDLAILPIGDNYTMGPDDAMRAVSLIRPKKVLPSTTTLGPDRPGRRGLGRSSPKPNILHTCRSEAGRVVTL